MSVNTLTLLSSPLFSDRLLVSSVSHIHLEARGKGSWVMQSIEVSFLEHREGQEKLG